LLIDAVTSDFPITNARRLRSWVNAVAVTQDGTQIVTAGADGTARIWDRVSGTQVGNDGYPSACEVPLTPARSSFDNSDPTGLKALRASRNGVTLT
jgi:WD40 repeat protein